MIIRCLLKHSFLLEKLLIFLELICLQFLVPTKPSETLNSDPMASVPIYMPVHAQLIFLVRTSPLSSVLFSISMYLLDIYT